MNLQISKQKEKKGYLVDYEIMLSAKRQDFFFRQEANPFFLSILNEGIKREIDGNSLSECYYRFFQFREYKHQHSHFGLISKKSL